MGSEVECLLHMQKVLGSISSTRKGKERGRWGEREGREEGREKSSSIT